MVAAGILKIFKYLSFGLESNREATKIKLKHRKIFITHILFLWINISYDNMTYYHTYYCINLY